MKIKHQDLELSELEPFENCKLERQPYARVLTEIIKNYEDGFVLALNNEWGTGKTTFVKMWKQLLINEGFQAIYFNAWKNDFNSNPLVAIMSELKPLTKGKVDKEEIFKSVIQKGAVLTKNIAPALAKAIIKKFVLDTDVIDEAVENATKAATEILEEEIKDYNDKKKTIEEFRTELERFIERTENKKPVVFIVDELDRCRPDYSVELLEQLKHFFSVTGIVFVLSIDKMHLASSIRGYYGTENINTDVYLRRFIDIEYSLPKPSSKAFSKYLFDYYEFEEFFGSPQRIQSGISSFESNHLLDMAELLFTKCNATLRQQEKIFGKTRLVLTFFKHNLTTIPHVLFFLIYLKIIHVELYQKIEAFKLSIQQLSDAFVSIIPIEKNNKYGINLLYLDALLIHLYNSSQDHYAKIQLFEKDSKGDYFSPIQINSNIEDNITFAKYLSDLNENYNLRSFNLNYLLNKISLIEPIL